MCFVGGMSIAQVARALHKCYTRSMRVGIDTLVFVVVLVCSERVNWADEGLGQPRQVMTAGTHGPSRQLMFDAGSIESCVPVKW